MIFERTTEQQSSWKNEMRDYQKAKRTKQPFGKSMPHVSHVSYQQVKTKQAKFNPLLQTYKHKQEQQRIQNNQEMNRVKSLMNHIKNVQKYEKNYDIINLHSNQNLKVGQKLFNKKLGPIRNAYNVINNQKLPDFYFKDRDLQIPVPKQKNLINYHKKEFDIITGNYKQNNEQRLNKEKLQQNLHVIDKYWKTHNFDPVYGKFYDAGKQENYQKEREQEEHIHGQNFDKRLPPSYVYRQPLILDFQKPLPQTLQTLDEREYNKKKKYQLKYVIQDQYQNRNFEQEDKHQKIIKNRVHDGRLLDQKAKEFNIITNNNYPSNRAESLYGKKPKLNNWEEYIKPTDNVPKFIKTSGFN